MVTKLKRHHLTGKQVCDPCGFEKNRPCSYADCPWKREDRDEAVLRAVLDAGRLPADPDSARTN